MLDNDENNQELKSSARSTGKATRSGLFNSGIFTRVSQTTNFDRFDVRELQESSVVDSDSHLSFIRRKCDEWLVHGLPKLAQLQFSIDDCDLIIDKEWQPFLTDESRAVGTPSTTTNTGGKRKTFVSFSR